MLGNIHNLNKISPLQRPSQIIIEEDEDFEDTSDSSVNEENYTQLEIRKSALQFISKTATQEEIDNGFRVSETGESLFPDTNVDMSSYNDEECNYTSSSCCIICLVIVTTIVVVSTI
tara:strand:+ start:498 stop:848 length:351 start_codon:yes stop_codon:yes gene_type:complete